MRELHLVQVDAGVFAGCVKCGGPLNTGKKFCSPECSQSSQRHRVEAQCRYCDKTFFPKEAGKAAFCSRACAFAAKNVNGKRHDCCPIRFVECGCGIVFASRHGRKYCSLQCQFNGSKRSKPQKEARYCKECCAEMGVDRHGAARYCSKDCAKKSKKAPDVLSPERREARRIYKRAYRKTEAGKERHRIEKRLRRAKRTDAYVAPVVRAEIYKRDGWICGICREKVNPKFVVPHPLAKTIDHIVPLAKGGTHEPKNVQLAHFICNSLKGAVTDGVQQRLI